MNSVSISLRRRISLTAYKRINMFRGRTQNSKTRFEKWKNVWCKEYNIFRIVDIFNNVPPLRYLCTILMITISYKYVQTKTIKDNEHGRMTDGRKCPTAFYVQSRTVSFCVFNPWKRQMNGLLECCVKRNNNQTIKNNHLWRETSR